MQPDTSPGAESAGPKPDYIAFRTADDDGHLLTVVAVIEPGDRPPFPWAWWYHERAPKGEFEKVPGDSRRLGIDEATAKTMIDLIKLGRPLPEDFVARLPVV